MITTKTLIIILTTFFIFITPILGLLALISFAVLFDTIFAIYVSIKLKGINSFKSTKLFIYNDNIEIIKFFLDKDMDINHKNNYGDTILSIACECGFFNLVKYLIDEKKNGCKLYK